VRLTDPGERTPGQALMDAAGDSMADLLIMGGYGHSRLREALFGGVTRHVVSHARIPVFMVH
jgi:nucleotide-binding universal stress UspA family protein